jgi:hypothetical protein
VEKMRTDEGKQQLEDIKEKKKLQARREVVSSSPLAHVIVCH